MMFINNFCTHFMFQEVMVCVTCSPSILSLIILNFLLVFKISQKFVEIYIYRFYIYSVLIIITNVSIRSFIYLNLIDFFFAN